MKEHKTFNQQLTILRSKGMTVPINGQPKRFLEQENYYNVINGYKDLFLITNTNNNIISPEQYIPGTHFDELKALFLFDRELRILFLEHILIFENSFKTTLSYEFSKKYNKINSYLDINNYISNQPKDVLQQISILTKTIHEKVDKDGAIKHYIQKHGHVPLWVLVNYLTIGNLAHLYGVFKDSDKNVISKFYADKYFKQYTCTRNNFKLTSKEFSAGLKIINLVRNICAHDERLYNHKFGSIGISNIAQFLNYTNYDNEKLIVAVLFLKMVLDKKHFNKFKKGLLNLFSKYNNEFSTVSFSNVVAMMGTNINDISIFLENH